MKPGYENLNDSRLLDREIGSTILGGVCFIVYKNDNDNVDILTINLDNKTREILFENVCPDTVIWTGWPVKVSRLLKQIKQEKATESFAEEPIC